MTTARCLAVSMASLVVLLSQVVILATAPGTVQGDLVRVDPEAMTLTIQEADGTQHEFTYTPATVVAGAQVDMTTLATMAGQSVTVQYEDGEPPIAVRIEVSV